MDIILVRLDNRLLHGIIATQWVQHTACERLMIIDDEVALDSQKKDIMRIAKPAGMPLSIITTQTAVDNFKKGKYSGKRVFVVARKPQTFLTLQKQGITIAALNIGGSAGEKDETIKLYGRYSCSEADQKCLEALKAAGVRMFMQYVPADTKIEY